MVISVVGHENTATVDYNCVTERCDSTRALKQTVSGNMEEIPDKTSGDEGEEAGDAGGAVLEQRVSSPAWTERLWGGGAVEKEGDACLLDGRDP